MRVQIVGQGVLADTYERGCQAAHGLQVVDCDPDVLWVCYDTPTHHHKPDVDWVCDRIAEHLVATPASAVVLLSSQLPIGTCARLERNHPERRFVVNPENIRQAHATQDFATQTRHICGARHHESIVDELLLHFTDTVLWMSPESAEMAKHAINGYLALCVRFGNELGELCPAWGADCTDVLAALRTERRVSPSAPLAPGDPPSPHLMREVHNLIRLGGGPVIRALA